MRSIAILLALIFVSKALHVPTDSPIDHFIVLMLENRPFDHMCGWLKRENPDIDGLTGKENNVYHNVTYYVNDTCPYVNPFDPDHSFDGTTIQIMGHEYGWINPAPMDGFVKRAALLNEGPLDTVMQGFSPERVPAISTLAREFALFDKYFVSFPGETIMNRLFFNMGSSAGFTFGNDTQVAIGYPGRTMYDLFDTYNITWRAYYEDISDLLYMQNVRNISNLLENFKEYTTFQQDVADGNLPQYTWVSPRFYPDEGRQARDQHPDHDVVEGERILAEVYSAVRNSPKWNRTALLVTYDEHGGFYDHVSPPWGVPNPMPGTNSSDDPAHPFNFTRLGLRVCTILVSPLVQKGTVVHEPQSAAYEATSMFPTLRNLFGFPDEPLTPRQAWAAPYDWLLRSGQPPRTDCPVTLPVPAEHSEERYQSVLKEMQKKKPNGLQQEMYRMVEGLHGRDGSGIERFPTQVALGKHVTEQHKLFFEMKRATTQK
jgi:phospholipase C